MNGIDGSNSERPLSFVIAGASGDLAERKLLPALFALFSQDLLPPDFRIFGFARSRLGDDEFRARAHRHLTCRYVPENHCDERIREFLARCFYVQGQYKSAESAGHLLAAMQSFEKGRPANRLYYLATPPSVFAHMAASLKDASLVPRQSEDQGWSRVVVEKPFGHDRESSDSLNKELCKAFPERDVYRIDHYLGKEIIQNLMVLRFANLIFEPLWNHQHIDNVRITWKEDSGIGSRSGYFDGYGIVRDVMQNHLLQILALVAMEEPASFGSGDLRNEKVRVLKSIPPLKLNDIALGQYRNAVRNGVRHPSYHEEEGVPADSITPTYAAAVLHVENERWRGIPFLLRAGKALDRKLNDISIRFRVRSRNVFHHIVKELPPNDLVIRVQPDEAIHIRIVNKVPDLKLELTESKLDLRYESAFRRSIPQAYERLLLDALQGDKSLFIRNDELAAAWDIFTPVLHEIEERRIAPEPYDFGSKGPAGAARLAANHGISRQ